MINQEIWILTGTAVALGFIHTLLGPDHYIPFGVMAKARQWALKKTLVIAFFSGLGHVLSSLPPGACNSSNSAPWNAMPTLRPVP
jgi:nickel/cobalt exporter